MSDAFIQVPPDSTGKKVDAEELVVGANTVERQRIQITGIAATDISPVSVTLGLKTNPSDSALRDMGKIDIALIDQYTPIDVDSGGPVLNAFPVTWRKNSAGGIEFGTSTDPVRIDPTGTTTQPVSGTVTATGPLTDAQLRATSVPVSDSQVLVDNAAFTDGTTKLFPIGYIYDEVAGTVLTENDIAAARLNLNRAQIFLIEDGVTRGRWATVTAANALKVDGSAVTQPISVVPSAATLYVTATAVVNTALTATLPAAGAGLFHYITSLELVKLYSVVGIANGAGVIITTTNMVAMTFTTEQLASVAGTATTVIKEEPATPFRSAVANTATTFVAPAQLQTIWRWNVRYFTAA